VENDFSMRSSRARNPFGTDAFSTHSRVRSGSGARFASILRSGAERTRDLSLSE
jgi:hypothetical protein